MSCTFFSVLQCLFGVAVLLCLAIFLIFCSAGLKVVVVFVSGSGNSKNDDGIMSKSSSDGSVIGSTTLLMSFGLSWPLIKLLPTSC